MAGLRGVRYTGRMIRTGLVALLLLPATTLAQVSVNRGALDQLKPSAPAKPTPAHPTPAPSSTGHTARDTTNHEQTHDHESAHRPAPAASRPATKSSHSVPPPEPKPKPRPRPVTIAPAPPPAAVLPPVAEAPKPATTPPPPPVPILADAAGVPSSLPGGVRITFGAGSSDLNPATAKAVQGVANEVKASPDVDLNVFAYAAGVADDPSTSRRLSLSRALAARAVLISEGIVSTRIYVRALGSTPSDGPADRVDVVRVGTPSPAPSPSAPAPSVAAPSVAAPSAPVSSSPTKP